MLDFVGVDGFEPLPPQFIFRRYNDLGLYRYEKWMESKGNSVTTISLYIRCLRHIFNVAIAKKLIDRDLYPFGPDKYLIPTGRNIKKVVSIDDIQRIYEYQFPDSIKMMYPLGSIAPRRSIRPEPIRKSFPFIAPRRLET